MLTDPFLTCSTNVNASYVCDLSPLHLINLIHYFGPCYIWHHYSLLLFRPFHMALGVPFMRPQLDSQKMIQLNISAVRINPSLCRKMKEKLCMLWGKIHLPCHIAMKTTANNIFFILNISNLFLFPLWKGQNLKKRQ